jgi:hypothetical protein
MKPNDDCGITGAVADEEVKRLVSAKSSPTSKRPISRWMPSSGRSSSGPPRSACAAEWILAVVFCRPACTKPSLPM